MSSTDNWLKVLRSSLRKKDGNDSKNFKVDRDVKTTTAAASVPKKAVRVAAPVNDDWYSFVPRELPPPSWPFDDEEGSCCEFPWST